MNTSDTKVTPYLEDVSVKGSIGDTARPSNSSGGGISNSGNQSGGGNTDNTKSQDNTGSKSNSDENTSTTVAVEQVVTPGNKSSNFPDLNADFWALQYITTLSQKDIINGFADGTFRPNENVSRAEFAKMIVKAMGWMLITPDKPSLSDITRNHWCYSYIETAKIHGVINGYKNGRFRPNESITRAEVAKMIVAAAQFSKTKNEDIPYKDVSGSFWASDSIVTAKANNIISGYKDGTFRPTCNATRAEAAKMIFALTGNK
jgi:hypothetical protein